MVNPTLVSDFIKSTDRFDRLDMVMQYPELTMDHLKAMLPLLHGRKGCLNVLSRQGDWSLFMYAFCDLRGTDKPMGYYFDRNEALLEVALDNNDNTLVGFLIENTPANLQVRDQYMSVFRYGSLDTIVYVLGLYPNAVECLDIQTAIVNCALPLIKYLHEHYNMAINKSHIQPAILSGKVDVLEYIIVISEATPSLLDLSLKEALASVPDGKLQRIWRKIQPAVRVLEARIAAAQ
eukprot:gene11546-13479_t